jgi:epoxyqueuosine reductase
MTPDQKSRWIERQALSLGFDLCGVAPVEGLDDLAHLPDWLSKGYAGEMKYLHDPRRAHPSLALVGARSLIVVALNYNTAHPHTPELEDVAPGAAPRGWISRYAWGDDYHDVLREKLNALVAAMRAEFPEPFETSAHSDTGPVIERVAAKYAGLGWLAKNTFLINQRIGSWTFLGVVITTLDLAPSIAPGQPPPRDLCGSCTRCLDACPTDAFPAPYVLDSRRCISYLTIELRGAIPEDLRAPMGSAVIGCDICQDVCPWNRKASVTSLAAFQPRQFEVAAAEEDDGRGGNSFLEPQLEWLASLSQEKFSRIFRKSAAKRAKWRGLVRNACVALGNSKLQEGSPVQKRIIELLEKLASSDEALIAEHARWALDRQRSP